MSDHTPGPWKIVDDHPDPNLQCLHVFHDDEQIADVLELKNACLIAAAPELLEALEALVLDESEEYIPTRLWDAARAAIAKAKGE